MKFILDLTECKKLPSFFLDGDPLLIQICPGQHQLDYDIIEAAVDKDVLSRWHSSLQDAMNKRRMKIHYGMPIGFSHMSLPVGAKIIKTEN